MQLSTGVVRSVWRRRRHRPAALRIGCRRQATAIAAQGQRRQPFLRLATLQRVLLVDRHLVRRRHLVHLRTIGLPSVSCSGVTECYWLGTRYRGGKPLDTQQRPPLSGSCLPCLGSRTLVHMRLGS